MLFFSSLVHWSYFIYPTYWSISESIEQVN